MVGKLSSHIVQFFIRKRFIFLFVFSLIIGLLINGLRRLQIEEDLYSIFPKGKEYQQFSDILQKNNLNKQIIFSLEIKEDEEGTFQQLDSIVEDLKVQFKGDLDEFLVYRNIDEKALISYLQASSIIYLTPNDYKSIQNGLSSDSIHEHLSKDAEKLKGSSGFFLRSILSKDPLGLTTKKLALLNPVSDSSAYTIKDGLLYSQDEKTIFFFASLKTNLKNTAKLNVLNDQLELFTKRCNQKIGGNKFSYFGTFQIAAENAKQIKRDTWLTTIISLGLILLLLVIYFRNILAPLYFVLPALFGILCGAGLAGYLHPEINAISLATSSVLLGIVLDYSFHFFAHFKETGDLVKTTKEISGSMILGSFTTVAALGALMFTDSVVLQDFGLIALCTLSGSVFFTLWFLPVIIHTLKVNLPGSSTLNTRSIDNHRRFAKIGIALVTLITVFFTVKGIHLHFDSDLNHLSYHSDELKKKEERYTGINPDKEKKLFIVSSANSEERARQINEQVYSSLLMHKARFGISELVSLAPYAVSRSKAAAAEKQWENFWSDRRSSIERIMLSQGQEFHFSDNAFVPFYTWIKNSKIDTDKGAELADNLGLSKFKYIDGDNVSYITSIVLDRSQLDACKTELLKNKDAFVLDISDLAEKMLETVQNDFNYLLLFSALLVFITLFLVYGRIELAMFAFFPMVLGWIWILGLSDLFGLSFNFVNIVIATFIFGLGDDFSIFTTDGLLQQYKTGVHTMQANRSAIVLSGITTLIGTGALIFAKHPSIHSIAFISVVGIATILFITLFVQPTLFELFITRRTAKRRVPITFFTLIYSLALFTYFFLGSILLNFILLFIILPFPAPKRKKQALLNWLVSKLAKSTIYAGIHVKKRIVNKEKLDFTQPSIIVANHSSFLDILLVIMLHPKAIIMVKSWVYNSPVFGLFIRYAGYPFAIDGAAGNIELMRQRINDGYSVVIFPEGTRSSDGEIKRFHKGAFFLSKELGVPIQPVLLIGANEVNPKNDILINKGHLNVVALDRVQSEGNETYTQFAKRVQGLMRKAFKENKMELAKTEFWQSRIIKNYIYKGPILEWYVRIKWKLEHKNFAFYDELINERKVIYDVGCGYGYLSYYLHYRDEERSITGIDYDEEKVLVAQNGIKKNDNLSFVEADVRHFNMENADVVFLNDVLHYLKPDEQNTVLHNILKKLNDNGILFIRDGLVNEAKKTRVTQLTEYFSTKLFKFNRVTNELYFLEEEAILQLAAENQLVCKKYLHSKTTSNVLFVLQKKGHANRD